MILAFTAFPGKRGPRWLAFSVFSLSFFACQSAFKGHPILCRGVRNKAMATGRARRTFRGRTRRTFSKKMRKVDPNQSKRYRQRTGQ